MWTMSSVPVPSLIVLWTTVAVVAYFGIGKIVTRGAWSSSKAKTYLFDLLFHTSTSAAGICAFLQLPSELSLPNLLDAHSLWWRQELVSSILDAGVGDILQHIVYANAGYYIFSFLLVASTTRRRDMLLHHFFSALMSIIGAYSQSFLPAVVVVVSHNVSDVFLLLGKLFQMRQTQTFLLLSDLSFYAFIACWMPTRVYFIPRYLAWPIVAENSIRLSEPTYGTLVAVVVVIQTLHFYWSAMILRLAYRKLTSDGATQTDDDEDS